MISYFFHRSCYGFSPGWRSLFNTIVYMIKSFLSQYGHFGCLSRHFDCTYTANLPRLMKLAVCSPNVTIHIRIDQIRSDHIGRQTIIFLFWSDWIVSFSRKELSHEQFTRRDLDNLGRQVLATSLTNSNQFEFAGQVTRITFWTQRSDNLMKNLDGSSFEGT